MHQMQQDWYSDLGLEKPLRQRMWESMPEQRLQANAV